MFSSITKTTALLLALATLAHAQLPLAPDPDEILAMDLSGPGQVVVHQVQGAPFSYYETFATFQNPFLTPNPIVIPVASGFLDASGSLMQPVFLPYGTYLPQIYIANVVYPPLGAPQLAFQAAAISILPAVAPCPSRCGAMSYDPTTQVVRLRGAVCPGDTVSIRLNGVVVATGVADANGDITLVADLSAAPPAAGSVITGTQNGLGWLGGITTP